MATEILEPAVEVVEPLSIELRVNREFNTELSKLGITEDELRDDAAKALTITISGIDDKEGYKKADEARKNLKVKRVNIQKTGKFMRDEATKFSKKVIERENELVGLIDEAESYLDKRQREIKDEKDRIEKEKEDRIAAVFATRIAQLSGIGVIFNGANFQLGEVVLQMADVRNCGDELYEKAILEPFIEEYRKVEAVRIEQERLRAEELQRIEDARIEAERLRMEAEAELDRQREQMRKEQEELRKQREEFEAKRREAERIEEEKRQQERLSQQAKEEEARKAEWEKQKAIEIEEQSKIAAEKAATQERERIEAHQKFIEQQKQAEEARKAEELLTASDKEKWQFFLTALSAVKLPEMITQ